MKKVYFLLTVFVLVFALFGCKSEPATTNQLELDPDIPDFVANPPTSTTHIFGVGSSTLASSTEAMRQADARARADLAVKINSEIEVMIIDYTRIAGTEINQTTALTFYENVSREVANTTLRGVEVIKRDRSRDGTTYYSLAQISREDAAQIAAEVLETEASMYAEFKAMEALKMMEAQLNK